MPLPVFLLWGAAAALAGAGVKKGLDAKDDFNRAERIGKAAQRRYAEAEANLEEARKSTNRALERLGKLKVSIFTNQISHLVDVIRKSKAAKSRLKNFECTITAEEFKDLERLVLQSLDIEEGAASGATTGALAAMGAYSGVGYLGAASTGAAISGLHGAAATNATLAWLGGGAINAGGFGIFGGTIALGGIVLGPALAVGGFMMASKAEEALTQARKYEAKADVAIADMERAQIVLGAIQENAKELGTSIRKMSRVFDAVKVSTMRNAAAFEKMLVVGKGLKDLLDVPVMNKKGAATKNISAKISGCIDV